MDQPYEYLRHSSDFQAEVITDLLHEFNNEVRQMRGIIMDLGCGPGNNTRDIILQKIPKEALVVGIDLSGKMIDCARTLNSEEKRLTFEQLNIETTNLPKELIGRFDSGLSFFCLQWLQDLRCTYGNIYKMLRPGGTFIGQQILVFAGYVPYLRLSENPRYKEYTKDVRNLLPPLLFDKNPRETLIQILQDVGLQVVHCSLREKVAEYASQQYRRDLFESVNPFISKMPKDLQKEYMDDLIQEISKDKRTMIKKSEDPKKEDMIFDLFTFIILHVKKPK